MSAALNDRKISSPNNSSIIVHGGVPLRGEVDISGSKHSILHILGALWLLNGEFVIRNVPNIWDVRYFLDIYKSFGMDYVLTERELRLVINPDIFKYSETKMELASKIRSSILLLGSTLVRSKYVKFLAPTGDRIGNRPFAEFFAVLEQFGISYARENGFIEAAIKKPLRGDRTIDLYSHGNNRTALAIILAGSNIGKTILLNPLPQPEILELCAFMDKFICPVEVAFCSSDVLRITIDGSITERKYSDNLFIIGPDKCEMGFWIATAAITQGFIKCHVKTAILRHDYLGPLANLKSSLLDELGIPIVVVDQNSFTVNGMETILHSIDLIVPYNRELTTGLSIDVCPQFIPLMAIAEGKSLYRDLKYGESRVTAIAHELKKMGIVTTFNGDVLEILGPQKIHGANVRGDDIRGAAALLVASLGIHGQSTMDGMFYINRGYSGLIDKLIKVGARIKRRNG